VNVTIPLRQAVLGEKGPRWLRRDHSCALRESPQRTSKARRLSKLFPRATGPRPERKGLHNVQHPTSNFQRSKSSAPE
jgi:hypothetical protein